MGDKILVIDDEPSITELLAYNLRRHGYEVSVAHDGLSALARAREEEPDLIILDLMLPGMDGLDVCRTLRRESRVPIIMVTARDNEIDRVVGLEIGADDYVTKPFSVRELMARVRATLRRVEIEQEVGPSSPPSNEVLRKGPLEIDLSAHSVRVAGVPLDLTRQAFDLLATLARHQGQALSREQLLNHVWGYDYYGDNRAVDSAIKRLRAELADAGLASDLIATVRGVGYRFDWDA